MSATTKEVTIPSLEVSTVYFPVTSIIWFCKGLFSVKLYLNSIPCWQHARASAITTAKTKGDVKTATKRVSFSLLVTMLIGLPGCGKSYYADGYRRNPNVKVFSSDDIREEVYGDASVQDAPDKIFDIMKQRTLEALDAGYDVVYDATNVIRKYRKELLKSLPEYVSKIATVCWAPLEVCIERDASRERKVGKAVIDKMLRRWETPYYDEGWDAIYFHNTAIWNP